MSYEIREATDDGPWIQATASLTRDVFRQITNFIKLITIFPSLARQMK